MAEVARVLGQLLGYALFGALLVGFSQGPAYVHLDPGLALVKLSFEHAGARVRECKRLTPEEIAKLAPNMRRALDCPRERVPLAVEFVVDGAMVYRETVPPSGLAGDGPSTVYARFPIAAGRHRLTARLRDSRRTEGFDYETSEVVALEPQRVLVVGFDRTAGRFTFLR